MDSLDAETLPVELLVLEPVKTWLEESSVALVGLDTLDVVSAGTVLLDGVAAFRLSSSLRTSETTATQQRNTIANRTG